LLDLGPQNDCLAIRLFITVQPESQLEADYSVSASHLYPLFPSREPVGKSQISKAGVIQPDVTRIDAIQYDA
jgi:hypothetical protein